MTLQVGDELAGIDPAPGEAHNYFALLEYSPGDLLRKLVKSKGCSPVAVKVASLLGVDLVEEVLTSCLPALRQKEYFQSSQVTGRSDGSFTGEQMKQSEGYGDAQEQQGKGKASAGSGNRSSIRSLHPGGSEGEIMGSESAGSTTPTAKPSKAPEPLCACATCQLASQIAQKGRETAGRKNGSSSAPQESEKSANPFSQRAASLQGNESEEATAEASILSVLLKCRAAEGLSTSRKQRAEAGDRDASEDDSEKSYRADWEAVELDKMMVNRKARMPGLPLVEEAEGCLTLDLLEKVAAVAPLRAFFATTVHIFARHDCLHQGPVPVLPSSEPSSAQPGADGSSRPSKQKKSRRMRSPEKGQRGPEQLSDIELRDFAVKIAAEKYPILQRWLLLQIDSIDSLRHLRSSKSLSARDFPSDNHYKRSESSANLHRNLGEQQESALKVLTTQNLAVRGMQSCNQSSGILK